MTRLFVLLVLAAALSLVALSNAPRGEAVYVPVRMTTGGSIIDPDILGDPTAKVRFGGVLQCDAGGVGDPNLLEVHVGKEAVFQLENVTALACGITDPDIRDSGGRVSGTGEGTCNGAAAVIAFIFDDAGAFDRAGDTASFNVSGGCAFAVVAENIKGDVTIHTVNNPEI